MAWDTDLVTTLRYVLFDYTTPYKFSDTDLKTVILVAARYVFKDFQFSTTYTIDLTNLTLDPDPTLTATLDDIFNNLVIMKAACLMNMGELRKQTGKSIRVSSGPSSLDTSGATGALKILLDQGYCKTYSDMLLEYKLSHRSTLGEAIFGPIVYPNRYGNNGGRPQWT